jgi:hypothetical protein
MSQGTVRQLYDDLDKLVKKNPRDFANLAMQAIFNANLSEAKRDYPQNAVLQAIPECEGQARLDDLLIRAGQLKQVLNDENPPRVSIGMI